MGEARRRFTVASLRLLANYRKRQQLVGLLKSLKTIKTLVRVDRDNTYCNAINKPSLEIDLDKLTNSVQNDMDYKYCTCMS